MNRLQAEFHRLYLPVAADDPGGVAVPPSLVDAQGRARALVLELARPADWSLLFKVWQGVQLDLGLPAPAIAVSGSDGIQLWFSLAQAGGVSAAQAFLQALCLRYLPDVPSHRLALLPALDVSSASGALLQARPVPAEQRLTGHWSVFVAPDLAPVFADEPWLDSPPGDDGQANLLRGLRSITPAEWAAVVAPALPAVAQPSAVQPGADERPASAAADPVGTGQPATALGTDARRFLLSVINDTSVALALRIDAAKALLPYTDAA
jgi:hypothetical protein